MFSPRLAALLAALAFGIAPPLTAAPTVFTGATLIDPGSGRVLTEANLVLDGERIVALGPAEQTPVPVGARVLDAKGRWILPGYIDSHVHFFQSGGLYTRPDAIDLNKVRSYARETELVRERLPDAFQRYLRTGVTAVLDIGGPMWNFEMRRLAQGNPLAPRVAAAGPLISSVSRTKLDLGDPPIVKTTTAEEARALVRKLAAEKADYVKIWFVVDGPGAVERFTPIVRATVEESRAQKIRVAIHATELEAARAAVEAGADLLVHSVNDKDIDDAFIALLRERGTILTPTLVVFERYAQTFAQQLRLPREELALGDPYVIGTLFDLAHLKPELVPENLRIAVQNPKFLEMRVTAPMRQAQKNLKRLQDADIPIAAGTDAGNIGTIHGPAIFREFALMREAGLTPMEILKAATATAARAFQAKAEFGSLAPGLLADLVVLKSDPLQDIARASDIESVVKGGVVHAASALVPDRPADVVQRQLNAYNARDLDAFLACYGEDVRIFTYPDRLDSTGLDAMRKTYGNMFKQLPKLHAEVTSRVVAGELVVDQERVTGLPNGVVLEGAAIYEVRNGLIRTVRFKIERK
ncbi:MAG: amidohydrolase family protein [Verrucomicrobia bacterium]|nr:amidohydrolase family protein [Verrucomicrobiota bacterium]